LCVCTIAFVDYDVKTAFGTPWELILEGSYRIVNKGGSVNGHTGYLTLIPELKLSMWLTCEYRYVHVWLLLMYYDKNYLSYVCVCLCVR